MRAIMVSVDYGDILSITLPYNRHHFTDVCVVTTNSDKLTQSVAKENGCNFIVCTDAFYRNGALFNKWLALEEGLSLFLGGDRKHRIDVDPWLCIMDADVLWPKSIPIKPADPTLSYATKPEFSKYLRCGYLYAPLRRMYHTLICTTSLDSITNKESSYLYVPPENTWKNYPIHPNTNEWAGYTQIFHLNDPYLGMPPWHEINWLHAGGADSMFQLKWPTIYKVRPSFEVLHLGMPGMNWCGRSTAYLDGSLPEQSKERLEQMRTFVRNRRRNGLGGDRHSHERIQRREGNHG